MISAQSRHTLRIWLLFRGVTEAAVRAFRCLTAIGSRIVCRRSKRRVTVDPTMFNNRPSVGAPVMPLARIRSVRPYPPRQDRVRGPSRPACSSAASIWLRGSPSPGIATARPTVPCPGSSAKRHMCSSSPACPLRSACRRPRPPRCAAGDILAKGKPVPAGSDAFTPAHMPRRIASANWILDRRGAPELPKDGTTGG